MRSNGRAFHPIHVKRVVINALHARFCRLTVHTVSIRIAKYFYRHDARLGQSGRYCRYR